MVLAAFCLAGQSLLAQVREFDVELYDTMRCRAVPLAVYASEEPDECRAVVIFSHGYGQNAPGSNKTYTYLTRELARCGYWVVSIQHELPDDEPLAMIGELCVSRRPNWERGVENIRFAIDECRTRWPRLPWNNIALIGHSNGGDMTMLFAVKYPSMIRKAISLDHRRMPVPRVPRPVVTTLRGCDYPSDAGVLPDKGEQRKYGIRIVRFSDIRHSDMDDKGTSEQHARICREVLRALQK